MSIEAEAEWRRAETFHWGVEALKWCWAQTGLFFGEEDHSEEAEGLNTRWRGHRNIADEEERLLEFERREDILYGVTDKVARKVRR